jgi:protein-disulfide isomerase
MTRPLQRAALLLLALSACTREDPALKEQLGKIDERLASIETMVKAGGGRGGPGAAGQRPSRPTPSPTDVYSIDIAGSPTIGKPTAKVTVVEGFEFACPYCRKMPPTIEQLKKDYGDDIRFVKKQFVVHPQVATLPALAFCAAGRQGKAAEMETALWEKGFDAQRNYAADNIDAIAKGVGVDMGKFKADMDGECKAQIQKEQTSLAAVGTSGTPAFYINGRFLSGARPIEQFKAIIDEELKKANERIGKEGVVAENYYQKWVVEKGKKKLDGA